MVVQLCPSTVDGILDFKLTKEPGRPPQFLPKPFLRTEELPAVGHDASEAGKWVRSYGQTLWSQLRSNDEVRAALDRALGLAAGECQPLYFHLMGPRAELFNWEMLCDSDKDRFLALDRRWPIGRIAEPGQDLALASPRCDGTLRIMAVLSALGVPAREEWEGIFQAVRDARADGLRIELRVLVSEQDLFNELRGRADGNPSELTVRAVPDRSVDVEFEIGRFAPHILHLFCHGSAGHGQSRLEFATPNDWRPAAAATAGSVVLHAENLVQALHSIWLVVLNCCEGAAAAPDVYSLALSLVANGVPAAIGMREPVNVLAANEFSRVFYRALCTEVRERLRSVAGRAEPAEVEIEWTGMLHEPRRALAEQHRNDPANNREWTLPVLYVRSEPFNVTVAVPRAGTEARDRDLEPPGHVTEEDASVTFTIEGLLRFLPPDTPVGVLEELRRRLPVSR
ncbi:MAG: CHAT domain-containing protein [Egibacteraceae bacterium]